MTEYNQYVNAVNKIFDYLAKMKAGWNSPDNYNYIESIEEYKQVVINSAAAFKETADSPKKQATLEELGHD